MSEPLFEIVEGWTGLIGPFTISKNGSPYDLTGQTVTLLMRRASGAAVLGGGVVTLLDQVTSPGQLTYTPVATDFQYETNVFTSQQQYALHWKMVDGTGKIRFSPHGTPSVVLVNRA